MFYRIKYKSFCIVILSLLLFVTNTYQVKGNGPQASTATTRMTTSNTVNNTQPAQEVNVLKDNNNVKVSLYDVTAKQVVTEKRGYGYNQLNNGNKDTNNYLELVDTSEYTVDRNNTKNSRYIHIDLGEKRRLSKIHLYRYFKDNRTYGPTVIILSNDPEFSDYNVVFSTDKDNVHQLKTEGVEVKELYEETSAGKEINFNEYEAQFIRIYVNGQDKTSKVSPNGTSDHIVELEVYEKPKSTNETEKTNKEDQAQGDEATSDSKATTTDGTAVNDETQAGKEKQDEAKVTETTLENTDQPNAQSEYVTTKEVNVAKDNPKFKVNLFDVTQNKVISEKSGYGYRQLNDGRKDTNNYLELTDTDNRQRHSRYVQLDLGESYRLFKIHLYRYFSDSRTYGPTVIALSNDSKFSDYHIVYSSDKNNVHNLKTAGVLHEELYEEKSSGKEITFNDYQARYVRIYVNGQDANSKGAPNGTSDHIVEFEAYAKIDYTNVSESANYDNALESALSENLSVVINETENSDKKLVKIGNKDLTRTFEVSGDKKLKTVSLINHLSNSVLVPFNSQEFIIKLLNGDEIKASDLTVKNVSSNTQNEVKH